MEQEAVVIYCPLLFLTINQLCIQKKKKDQKKAEYQAALRYNCSKGVCHYTSHIHLEQYDYFVSRRKVFDHFKLFPIKTVISGSG